MGVKEMGIWIDQMVVVWLWDDRRKEYENICLQVLSTERKEAHEKPRKHCYKGFKILVAKDSWSGHPPWQEYGEEAMLKEYDT